MSQIKSKIGGMPDLPWKIAAHVAIKQHSFEIDKLENWLKTNIKGRYHIGLPNPMYFKFEYVDDAKIFVDTHGGELIEEF